MVAMKRKNDKILNRVLAVSTLSGPGGDVGAGGTVAAALKGDSPFHF